MQKAIIKLISLIDKNENHQNRKYDDLDLLTYSKRIVLLISYKKFISYLEPSILV